jgi:hypothetical protein
MAMGVSWVAVVPCGTDWQAYLTVGDVPGGQKPAAVAEGEIAAHAAGTLHHSPLMPFEDDCLAGVDLNISVNMNI